MHRDKLYLHIDGDSFFVACELTKRPELVGKPVIVGGDRGIAVAMSVEAKKLGVTRGMPVFQIKRELPQVIILPHDFELYEDISHRMFFLLKEYFSRVEKYSIDECFAIVKPSDVKFYKGEKNLLKELKKEVEETLGVSYSYGLARTKALAKQASKLRKPRGVVMLLDRKSEIEALKKTKIKDVWGIGRQTVPHLRRLGIKTAYDFTKFDEEKIEKLFSKSILVLKRELSGEELMDVEDKIDPRDQKSIQSTRTFNPASTDPKVIWREISKNAEHACEDARFLDLVTNKVSFFVKNSDFKYFLGEVKLKIFTSDPGVVLSAIESSFNKIMKTKKRIRSTGVMLHNLTREENVPVDLFGEQEKALGRISIEKTADKIREKYGRSAIKRATSLDKN